MPQGISQLINTLLKPESYPHLVSQVELIETHISWVFLTGETVYKIKKPVDLGFLDFSSLEKRRQYCELEVSLNKRLAPDYYLNVTALTGNYQQPEFDGSGEIIEYAVKMRQFPQDAQLDRVLVNNKLTLHHMDLLANKIAEFHTQIKVAGEKDRYGELEKIHAPVRSCFSDILIRLDSDSDSDIKRVKVLQDWSEAEFRRLKDKFLLRKSQGFIRECHGDLHLRNIAIVDEEVIAFDGIEFNEDLRWNDVMSEIAFLVMDLQDHEQTALASRFLNRYLEISGDYAGLCVLQYYLLYRAIVRAMVSCIRLKQEGLAIEEISSEQSQFKKYLALAESYVTQPEPELFITFGLSGSGKTTVSQVLLQEIPAIRIRSDVERKRICGLAETQRDLQGSQQGIYTASVSEKTYAHLVKLAEYILNSGYSVIIDAAFLKAEQRALFADLAYKNHFKYTILVCEVPLETAKMRIIKRNKENTDASDAGMSVLEHQVNNLDQLTTLELQSAISINQQNVMASLNSEK